MNAPTTTAESTALAHLDTRAPTGRDLILQTDNLNAMVRVADFGRDFIRLSRFCTKHGRGHRTPEGEQHANKQQNEDAKKSH